MRKYRCENVKLPSFFLGVALTTAALGLAGWCSSTETLVLIPANGDVVQLTPLDLIPSGTQGATTHFEVHVEKDGEPFGFMMGSMVKVTTVGDADGSFTHTTTIMRTIIMR